MLRLHFQFLQTLEWPRMVRAMNCRSGKWLTDGFRRCTATLLPRIHTSHKPAWHAKWFTTCHGNMVYLLTNYASTGNWQLTTRSWATYTLATLYKSIKIGCHPLSSQECWMVSLWSQLPMHALALPFTLCLHSDTKKCFKTMITSYWHVYICRNASHVTTG